MTGGMITIEHQARRSYLVGDTYPLKEKIKSLGGHWDPDRKAWWIGAEKRSAAEQLIQSAPVTTPGVCSKCGGPCKPPYTLCLSCKPYTTPQHCKQCGARPNASGWPRIYRNGICSDCYQSDREEADMGY